MNQEVHLRPILGTVLFDENSDSQTDQAALAHSRMIWDDIASQLGCKVEDIMDFDLCFADSQPGELIVGLTTDPRDSIKSSSLRLGSIISSRPGQRSIVW